MDNYCVWLEKDPVKFTDFVDAETHSVAAHEYARALYYRGVIDDGFFTFWANNGGEAKRFQVLIVSKPVISVKELTTQEPTP